MTVPHRLGQKKRRFLDVSHSLRRRIRRSDSSTWERELRVRTNPLKYQDRTVSIFIQIGLRHLAARNISYYFLGAESTKQQSDMHRYV